MIGGPAWPVGQESRGGQNDGRAGNVVGAGMIGGRR